MLQLPVLSEASAYFLYKASAVPTRSTVNERMLSSALCRPAGIVLCPVNESNDLGLIAPSAALAFFRQMIWKREGLLFEFQEMWQHVDNCLPVAITMQALVVSSMRYIAA
jgi:hypothetical protein